MPGTSGAVDKFAKYYYHSDSNLKDRVAQLSAPGNKTVGHGPEPSEFTTKGWDKYFFYSVPADNSVVGPTTRLGRSRPAMTGPNTFAIEAFSKEVIARERTRIEARGGGSRTAYTEMFSQLPRAGTAVNGPLRPHDRLPVAAKPRFGAPPPSMLAKSASDSVIGKSEGPTSADIPIGPNGEKMLLRDGPFWPPKEKMMPDSVVTRQKLFGGEHRSFVDLYAKEIPAAKGFCYTVMTG